MFDVKDIFWPWMQTAACMQRQTDEYHYHGDVVLSGVDWLAIGTTWLLIGFPFFSDVLSGGVMRCAKYFGYE